jgi:hypothetical protein
LVSWSLPKTILVELCTSKYALQLICMHFWDRNTNTRVINKTRPIWWGSLNSCLSSPEVRTATPAN